MASCTGSASRTTPEDRADEEHGQDGPWPGATADEQADDHEPEREEHGREADRHAGEGHQTGGQHVVGGHADLGPDGDRDAGAHQHEADGERPEPAGDRGVGGGGERHGRTTVSVRPEDAYLAVAPSRIAGRPNAGKRLCPKVVISAMRPPRCAGHRA